MSQPLLSLSPATAEDLPAMHDVYAHHVLNGTGSFEEVPPTLDDIGKRWNLRELRRQPTLVARYGNQCAGFAYAASHKERSAYRFTVEDSVYVAAGFEGRQVGQALLNELIGICSQREYKQMIAVIGDSNNVASIKLHKRCGFRHVGTANGLGFKFGKWLDIVYMQRSLG